MTSFPFFPETIGGGTVVRPFSLYPLIILLVLVTLPRLVHEPVPETVISLVPFVLFAIASSLLSFFRGIEPVLGVSVTERVLRAFFTLGIGCLIYLTVALLPRSFVDLRFSLRWLYAGMAGALLWGSLQAIYVIQFNQAWYEMLGSLQRLISIRRLIEDRISGLTYEPHWFADQISFLLLPWLLAAVISGYSAFRWRWRGLTLEWILLGWSVLLLPFTFSRAGVLNLIILITLAVLVSRYRAVKNISLSNPRLTSNSRIRLRSLTRTLAESLFILILAFAPIYLVGTKNLFFSRLWDYWGRQNPNLSSYLNYLGFGPRLAYSGAAINTYEQHVMMGVGLGNFAFYFEDMLPDRPLAEYPEVLRLITPEAGRDRLITVKNFYLRLMAETGIIGLATFLTFVVAVIGCVIFLWLSTNQEERYWGLAGLFGMASFFISAISFDSFVLPNMWVVFGMITAAAWISRRSMKTGER